MKQKYVMPEIEHMKACVDEFYLLAKEFIKKQKQKEKEGKNEHSKNKR